MAKVYVSSTVLDLKAERQAVFDWLVQAGHQPAHSYRSDSETVRDNCLNDIDQCALYVLIMGHRYGYIPEEENPEHLSIAHLEYRRARQAQIPRIVLLHTTVPDITLTDLRSPVNASRVTAFTAEVQREGCIAQFTDIAGLIRELNTGVSNGVAKIVDAPHDAQVRKVVATLSDTIDERQNQGLSQYEAEHASLRDQLEALQQAAVARTLAAAARPDASGVAVRAAQSLETGNTGPTEAWMQSQEREEVAQIGSSGADDPQHRHTAAALAREQGALVMGHDVRTALSAFMRAADYEPNDTWTHFFIGDLHSRLGDLTLSIQSYRYAQSRAEARLDFNMHDLDAQRDLSVSYDKIGDVLVAQGDGPVALPVYRKSLTIREALAARDAANTQWQRDLSVSHNKIGDVLAAQGDGPVALATYRKGLTIREALAARDVANTQWQWDLSVSYDKIGDVLVAQGDDSGALAAYREGLTIREALAACDAANTQWQIEVAVSCAKLGTHIDVAASERRSFLQRGLKIQHDLNAEGRLTPNQNWIEWFDEQLLQLDT